jgi:ParB family transcriptional regulator, chromosome partitioning protein
VSQHTVPTGEPRTVALADIYVQDGFNPRDRFERGELDALTRSIAAHGVLQLVVVAVDGNGYKLLAGERRYRAA